MNADGSGRTSLTRGNTNSRAPSYSPDGSQIAFASDRDGDYEIYVMNADGSNQTLLTDNEAEDRAPAFSPDGAKIAFTSDRDGNYEIYVMDTAGTGQTRLTTNSADDWDPAFSPDGTKIAFQSYREESWDIYLMNAVDGDNEEQLWPNDADEKNPAFSPDGAKIAFDSTQPGNRDIYSMNLDGTDRMQLTGDKATDRDPAFSPDGAKIAYESNRDGNYEIYIMNADGTSQTQLTDDKATDIEAVFSPDGAKIAYASKPYVEKTKTKKKRKRRPRKPPEETDPVPPCSLPSTMPGSASSASLGVKLTPLKPGVFPFLRVKIAQPRERARSLKGLSIRLGEGESAVQTSTRGLARKGRARRSGIRIGRLRLTPVKGKQVGAIVFGKRGRIHLRAGSGQSRTTRRHLRRKTRLVLKKSVLRLSGLPRTRYTRIDLTINGKRGRILRNPKGCTTVAFSATLNPYRGKAIKASTSVRLSCNEASLADYPRRHVNAGPSAQSAATWPSPGSLSPAATRSSDSSTREADRWSSPTEVSAPGQGGYAPQVAVGPHGDAVAAWERSISYDPESDRREVVIQAATRSASGSWSKPLDISAYGISIVGNSEPDLDGGVVRVTVDLKGNAIAVWSAKADPSESREAIQAATRPVNGSWSKPQDISSTDNRYARDPQLAIDREGDAIVVWDGGRCIKSASRPAGGAWTPAVDISAPSDGLGSEKPRLAVSAQGNPVAVWWNRSYEDPELDVAQGAVGLPNGSWSMPVDISKRGRSGQDLELAADPRGNAVTVWRTTSSSDKVKRVVQAVTYRARRSWSKPEDITRPSRNTGPPDVAIDSEGSATVVWSNSRGTWAKSRPANGRWSRAEGVFLSDEFSYQQLILDTQGNAVVLGTRSESEEGEVEEKYHGKEQVLQAITHPVHGFWSAPVDVSSPSPSFLGTDAVIDSRGNAIAVWSGSGKQGTGPHVQSASLPGRWTASPRTSSSDPALRLRVGLSSSKPSAHPLLRIILTQRRITARPLRSLNVKLGRGEGALRVSARGLARRARGVRKGERIGRLALTPVGGKRVDAYVYAKNGRIHLRSKSRRPREVVRYLRRKTEITLGESLLRLTGLPRTRYRRIYLTLNGKRGGLLRNPKECSTVVFSGQIKPHRGKTIDAVSRVRLRC